MGREYCEISRSIKLLCHSIPEDIMIELLAGTKKQENVERATMIRNCVLNHKTDCSRGNKACTRIIK